jgi:hypothetical protein
LVDRGQVILGDILSGLNEEPFSLKDMLFRSPALAAIGQTVAGDDISRHSFANFAFENFDGRLGR